MKDVTEFVIRGHVFHVKNVGLFCQLLQIGAKFVGYQLDTSKSAKANHYVFLVEMEDRFIPVIEAFLNNDPSYKNHRCVLWYPNGQPE